MSAFSNEMAALATELLTDFGETVTINLVSNAGYNTATGSTTSSGIQSFQVKAVPIDYSTRELNNTMLQQGDIRLYAENISAQIKADDKVILSDNVEYRVVNVIQYKLNAANVLYELQLRA